MRRLVKLGLIFVLLVGGLPALYFWYASWRGERLVNEIVADLDAAGPWRWDDLVAARPATPQNQLAPKLVEKVADAIPRGFSGAKIFQDLPDGPEVLLTPEQSAALSEQMEKVKELVAEARGILKLPPGRLRLLRSLSRNNWSASYQRVQQYHHFSVLMYYDALHQAQLGDLDAAMKSNQAIQKAALAIDDELTVMPYLTRAFVERMSLLSLERTLAQGQPSLESLARMQKTLTESDPVAAFRAAVAGERAHMDRLCQALASGETDFARFFGGLPGARSVAERTTEVYLRVSLQESWALMLKSLTQTLEAVDLPGAECHSRLREIDKKLRDGPAAARQFNEFWPPAECHQAFVRGLAKRPCAIAALAVERFRRETGRWPKTLDELAPKFLAEVPADPFADQPLGYRHTRDGVVLYSVGPEGKFGGTYRDEAQPSERGSYEFRLWNKSQRRQPPRP